MISIFVADDHPLILRGIRELFSKKERFRVVGEELDPGKVFAAVESLRPDILIQDLSMAGGMRGLDVVRDVHTGLPSTGIVVLTMHSRIATVCDAMRLGASAFVSKLGDMQELIEAVDTVAAGGRYIGKPFSEQQVIAYARESASGGAHARDSLTKRELQVLSMVVRGHTSGEIADVLQIGRRTVESHRANVSSKLGVRNQAELVRYANSGDASGDYGSVVGYAGVVVY